MDAVEDMLTTLSYGDVFYGNYVTWYKIRNKMQENASKSFIDTISIWFQGFLFWFYIDFTQFGWRYLHSSFILIENIERRKALCLCLYRYDPAGGVYLVWWTVFPLRTLRIGKKCSTNRQNSFLQSLTEQNARGSGIDGKNKNQGLSIQ